MVFPVPGSPLSKRGISKVIETSTIFASSSSKTYLDAPLNRGLFFSEDMINSYCPWFETQDVRTGLICNLTTLSLIRLRTNLPAVFDRGLTTTPDTLLLSKDKAAPRMRLLTGNCHLLCGNYR